MGMSSLLGTQSNAKHSPVASVGVPPVVSPLPMDVLRQVLDLEKEGKPTLDVAGKIQYALAHPDREVIDSLGAVSVVCMLYGAYSPDTLIPAKLLTHRNFSTLNGLKKVIEALNKKQGTP